MTTRKASRSTSMDRDDDSFDHYENASGISFPDRESISTRDNSDGMIVQEVQETRLVIGLDYGTTYTGVAYATPSGTYCSLEDIDVMVEWGAVVDDKVPSVISYSRPDWEWGGGLSDNSVSMVHTKLELGLQSTLGELDMTLQVLDGMLNLNFKEILMTRSSQDVPAYSHKNPEEIVTDYLGKVFQYLEQEVGKFGPVARKHTITDLVVTVPTEWSYMAMNSTYRALMKAGFNRVKFPRLQDVMFITEPEAAALYTARHYRDEMAHDILEEAQYFILCDAGGGTVDVVSYQVKRLHPTLQLEQIGQPTGDKCGSIFINQEFRRWLRAILTDAHYKKLDPNLDIEKFATHASETPAMRSLMKEFDLKKRTFGAHGLDCKLELPAPLDNHSIPGRVDQGLLTIRRHEMESFFDASIARIAKLIKDHVRRIRELRRNRPKNLFLVGGYGESEYLQAKVAEMLKHERMVMEFRRPRKSWTAVVRGAVVCGVEKLGNPSLKRTSSCRHSYGICMDESYMSTHHSDQDVVEKGGKSFAQSQLTWLLDKGDLILSDAATRREETVRFRRMKLRHDTVSLTVWQNLTDEVNRPTRLEDASDELGKAGELVVELSKDHFERVRQSGLGKPAYFVATCKLVLELEWDKLWASLWWKETQLAKIALRY